MASATGVQKSGFTMSSTDERANKNAGFDFETDIPVNREKPRRQHRLESKLMRIFVQRRLLLFFFALSILLRPLGIPLSALANTRKGSFKCGAARADLLSVVAMADDLQSDKGRFLKQPRSRAVSAKEAKRILETTEHSVDQELSRIILSEAFDLADGGVLLIFDDGRGRLYESKDELRAMLDEAERKAEQGPQSVCHYLPYGQSFIEHVPDLVAQLPPC